MIHTMKKQFVNITTLLLLFFSACTERMDIKLDETYTRLVVVGSITSDTMQHKVTLTKSTSYYYNQPAPPAPALQVTISDDAGTVIPLTETPPGSGVWLTPENTFGTAGRTYTLDIELTEELNGEKNYEASCAMMPVAPLDSIDVVYIEPWEAWEVQCYALDPPTVDFYMFELFKNNVLISDTLYEIFVVDDSFYNGNYTNGVGVGYFNAEDPDEVVHAGDTITLRMGSITKDYMFFLYDLQTEPFDYNNPLFSGPPANVPGNISNGGLGYFTAYSVSYATKIYDGKVKRSK